MIEYRAEGVNPNMKYVYECYFTEKPECSKCMLCRTRGLDGDGETVSGCAALGIMPRCPDEGCREDCPLKESNT